jgi:hypothetical protein
LVLLSIIYCRPLFLLAGKDGDWGCQFFCVSGSFRLECELSWAGSGGWAGRGGLAETTCRLQTSRLLSSTALLCSTINVSTGKVMLQIIASFHVPTCSCLSVGTVSAGPVPGFSKCERCGSAKTLLSCCQVAEENAIVSSGSCVSTILILYFMYGIRHCHRMILGELHDVAQVRRGDRVVTSDTSMMFPGSFLPSQDTQTMSSEMCRSCFCFFKSFSSNLFLPQMTRALRPLFRAP